jgi:hypothetical protein
MYEKVFALVWRLEQCLPARSMNTKREFNFVRGLIWARNIDWRQSWREREIIKSGSLWLAWVRAAGPEAAPGAVALQLVWVARDIELVAMATQRRERRPQPSGHLLQFILSIERMVPAARYLICIYTHRQTCFKMLPAPPGPAPVRLRAHAAAAAHAPNHFF